MSLMSIKPSQRYLFIGVSIIITLVVILMLLLSTAPPTTDITLTCVADEAGDCLRLPQVTGITLNGADIVVPDAFEHAINLVVIPFNQAQQERAVAWLPLFEALAQEHDDIAYYSFAVLPDLSPALRLVIQTSMQLVISDPDLRALMALAYLSNQDSFLEALAIPDTEAMQVFILNREGDVLWQTQGDYDESHAQALRQALAQLPTD